MQSIAMQQHTAKVIIICFQQLSINWGRELLVQFTTLSNYFTIIITTKTVVVVTTQQVEKDESCGQGHQKHVW
jgi:hypothetical protein